MGKITAINNVSLDGVMQAPAAPDEDIRGGFTHGGWTNPYQDSVINGKMGQMMKEGENGSLLLGRRTYEHLFSVWSKQTNNPYSEHLNRITKYVASNTLKEPLPWQNSILLQGDAADKVEKIKKQNDSNLSILGSGKLIKSLINRNLIDEFVLLIFPITLGEGFRLFPDGSSIRLRLVDLVRSNSGVIITTYRTQ
jgi:dihydrofolate reductase